MSLSFGLCAAIVYLAAHAMTGRQGVLSYVALQQEERALAAESQALNAQRDTLLLRAARLRTDAIEPDYLEERARVLFDAARANEIIFVLPRSLARGSMDAPAGAP